MNEITVNDNNTVMSAYKRSDNILGDIENIIETSQQQAYRAVNNILTQRNWFIGYRISEELIGKQERSEYYGTEVIANLSKELTRKYGKGYDKSTLYRCYRFYKAFPEIVDTVRQQSYIQLSWSHYRELIQVLDEKARSWYCKEAFEQVWSVRTLKRNIETQYYYRMLKSQHPDIVKKDMEEHTATYQNDKLEFIKNPIIAEFLGMETKTDFTETELESYFISNIQKFIMELGKGYAFVGRQQHIKTEKEDYFIDLVFYNYILKCFVLFDLKTGKITHQDVGQMDMYIRMYDELKRGEGDNPTLGVVLCSETDEDIARYSVMHGSEQLFASKYKLYLPTEEELKAEIEMQKAMFEMQHSDSMKALTEAQEAFKGEAEANGLHSEEDVVNLIKEIREDKQE